MRQGRKAGALLALLFVALVGASSAHAATINVTTTADGSDSGQCTLRGAIANANSNSQEDPSCLTGAPGLDTINFLTGGTINLVGPLPTVTEDLVVDGTGAGVTISGRGLYQILNAGPGAALDLTSLTLTNGVTSKGGAGGAVTSSGSSLTITGCTLSGNTAKVGLFFEGLPGEPGHWVAVGGYGAAVYAGATVSLSIVDSLFSGNQAGGSGGGVYSDAPMSVANSVFTGNSADQGGGAVQAWAGIAVTSSSFSSNSSGALDGAGGGGAIDVVGGRATITDSTFVGNSTPDRGGALKANGSVPVSSNQVSVTITSSTFQGNSAKLDGGAVAGLDLGRGLLTASGSTFSGNSAVSNGGALFAYKTRATISNATFVNNSVQDFGGAVGFEGQASAHITASTFSANHASKGSSLWVWKTSPSLKSTILATGGPGANCFLQEKGGITDSDYNISDDGSCRLTAAHSRSNTDPGLADAGLAPNGGPTPTIALASGSPSIDAIPPTACTDASGAPLPADQRGFTRLADGDLDGVIGCDVGAYEAGSAARNTTENGPTFTANATADSHDPVCLRAQYGSCSLHDAIMAANAYSLQRGTPATVSLQAGMAYTLDVLDNTGTNGANALPKIIGTVTVQGAGATIKRDPAAPPMRLLQVADTGRLTIVRTELSGGNATGQGGGLLNLGTLTLKQSLVRQNASGGTGGGLYNGGTAIVTGSTFSANQASANGGAVFNRGKQLTVANSTATGNSAVSAGAIVSSRGGVRLINATLSFDSASQGAEEVAITGGSSSFSNTIVGFTVGAHNCTFAKGAAHKNVGHNVDSGSTCRFGSTNSSTSGVSPGLGALADYGGFTPTMQLKAGSPAINAGDNAVCQAAPINNVDQRGVTRITSGDPNCDIGAFEYQG